jgi:hypothetical protein
MSDQRSGSFHAQIEESIQSKRMKTNEEWHIDLKSSKFEDILKSDGFVDKTMVIKEVLAASQDLNFLVTAPRRFGKSMIADMLRLFLTIEVDENGNRKTRSNGNEPIRDTENYRLFANHIPSLPERNLNISKEQAIMDKYLGKHPVIYIDFKSPAIHSFNRAVSACKRVIRHCYLDHKYLCRSAKLDADEKADCIQWCSDNNYLTASCDKLRITDGLRSLSQYLVKHFEAKCFVIVDEYDSMCCSAMFKVEDTVLDSIIEFFSSCLDFVVKDNDTYIQSAFLTGISYICTTGLSRLGNVDSFKFLDNDKFSKFYGVTLEEAEDLKNRLLVSETEFAEALEFYNGYHYKDERLLSIYSFMHYLKFRELKSYWRNSGSIENLDETLRIQYMKYDILYMLSDLNNTVKIEDIGKINVKHICNLKTMLKEPNVRLIDNSLLFMFLVEQGYFSIHKRENNEIHICIPNEEIKSEFTLKMKEYLEKLENYGLNFELVKKCAAYWNNINFTDENNIIFNLKQICKVLNQIFAEIELDECNEACFHHILFVILLYSKFKCYSEALCSKYINRGKLDLFLTDKNCGIINELKFGKTCKEALECIIDRNYCDKFEDGNLVINNYILIGSNMDKNKLITLCCLINKNKKTDEIIYIN